MIKATEELPRIPVTATTEGAGRAAQAVGQLSGLARDIALDLAQKQQGIKRARQVAQAEIAMEKTNRDIIAKLRLEPNHETYFEDWLNEFEFASTDMLINAKGQRTKAEMEQVLNRIAVREARIQKDYANQLWLETEQTEVARALQGYATEGRYDDGIKLIDSVEALYSPKELLTLKTKFKASYDKVQKELADVAADQAIIKNAKQAAIDLKNKDYLPNLEPMQRQDKIEKAKAAAKILENEKETKLKEAEKKAHDEEEREIGNKFLTGDYKDAFDIVLRSKYLTGDEKRTWNNAIEKASKGQPPTVDYSIYRNLSLRASQGIITDAEDLYDLVGKGLTIQNVKDIQKIMKDAADPAKKHETELIKLAISSGKKRILKPDPLTLFAFQADSEKQAFLFEHALRAELEKEENYQTRINMITPGTKEYIIDDLVNTYDLDMMGTSKPDKERKPLSFYSE